MLKKTICLFLSAILLCSLLTGCSFSFDLGKQEGETEAYQKIQQATPLTLSEVAGRRLVASTNEERESAIYKYVVDRIIVDPTKLIKVSGQDETNIHNLFSNINKQLRGVEFDDADAQNPLIDEFANYLLLEFSRTPFEWEESNKNILGFDPSARLYFVDVTYTTTSNKKIVVEDSKIPLGAPDAEIMRQTRYQDYIKILTMRYRNQENSEKYKELYDKFIEVWGPEEDIFLEQQGTSLYERTKLAAKENSGIGRLTYSGLQSISDKSLYKGATMTVRYVLKYQLNLGEETDMMVEALYMTEYKLNDYEKVLSQYSYSDTSSLEVLKPFIDQLIWSYNKCVEESNFDGLYTLYENFANIDKFYEGIRDYTYNSIGGYSYEVINREGREVLVRVDNIPEKYQYLTKQNKTR